MASTTRLLQHMSAIPAALVEIVAPVLSGRAARHVRLAGDRARFQPARSPMKQKSLAPPPAGWTKGSVGPRLAQAAQR
jgi:hypothetical protein